jgi:hypothetical protein
MYINYRLILDGDTQELECAYDRVYNNVIEIITDNIKDGSFSGTVCFDVDD